MKILCAVPSLQATLILTNFNKLLGKFLTEAHLPLGKILVFKHLDKKEITTSWNLSNE